MKKAVMCIVKTQVEAESIVSQLRVAGFPNNDISVLLPDQQGSKDFAHEHNTKAPEGAIAGVGAGGVLGGTLGLLAGIGALAIPGLGSSSRRVRSSRHSRARAPVARSAR